MITERGIELAVQDEDEPTKESDVFYNAKMQLNRDISVLGLEHYADKNQDRELKVLDALAASGIRGFRYKHEINDVTDVIANDSKPAAVENIKINSATNEIDIEATNRNANSLMVDHWHQLDVIDIDPFGSPAPYSDTAAQALNHDGLLMVTATDLGALCGTYIKTCRRRYSSWPLKTSFCHEIGLRILLTHLFNTCGRHDKVLRPKISYYDRHYYRIIAEVHETKKGVNRSLDNIGHLGYCWSCDHRTYFKRAADIEHTCKHCDEKLEITGPLWIAELGHSDYLNSAKKKANDQGWNEAAELIETLHGENVITKPYFDTHRLAAVTGKQAPSRDDLIKRLRETGYQAVQTHFAPTGIRTPCPVDLLKEMI